MYRSLIVVAAASLLAACIATRKEGRISIAAVADTFHATGCMIAPPVTTAAPCYEAPRITFALPRQYLERDWHVSGDSVRALFASRLAELTSALGRPDSQDVRSAAWAQGGEVLLLTFRGPDVVGSSDPWSVILVVRQERSDVSR